VRDSFSFFPNEELTLTQLLVIRLFRRLPNIFCLKSSAKFWYFKLKKKKNIVHSETEVIVQIVNLRKHKFSDFIGTFFTKFRAKKLLQPRSNCKVFHFRVTATKKNAT